MKATGKVFILGAVVFSAILFSCGSDADNKGKEGENKTDSLAQADVELMNAGKNGIAGVYQLISERLGPTKETFVIDQTKDSVITCAKGTKLFIEANSLVLEDGSAPKEKVTVEVQEFYSKKDFFAAQLATVSNGVMLESGGMVNVSATSGSQKLELGSGKEMAVLFPRSGNADQKDVFYGSKDSVGNMNWDQNPSSVNNSVDTSATKKEKRMITVYNTLEWFGVIENAIVVDKPPFDNDLAKVIQNFANHFDDNFKPSKKLVKEGLQNGTDFHATLKFDKSGKVSSVKFKPGDAVLQEEISGYLKKMPKIEIPGKEDKLSKCEYDFHFGRRTSQKASQVEAKDLSPFRKKVLKEISNAEVEYYVLSSANLGWINCDKFYNTPGEKTNFFVNTQGAEDTRVFLLFNDIKSGMNGGIVGSGRFSFPNLPVGYAVKVIAISTENGNPKLATAETKVSTSGYELQEFKSFSMDKLDQELGLLK
ncbi:MAG: hypothetical protein IAF38_07920 [Bacteroidia bacterium]|nr:hypothetical protein [Bacteroidia bacterium]